MCQQSGLEDQFLSRLVSIEQPKLEAERIELGISSHNYHIELNQLEILILQKLEDAPVDILSDLPLIESLEETKFKSTSIQEAMVKAKRTELSISRARDVYRIVATEAAAIYFVAMQLSSVNPMYQFSLHNFELYFVKGMEEAEENEDQRRRVANMRQSVRYELFGMVTRGLFDRHRVAFLTRLAVVYMEEDVKYQVVLAARIKADNDAK
jgi:dynein heavy chain, axonemal